MGFRWLVINGWDCAIRYGVFSGVGCVEQLEAMIQANDLIMVRWDNQNYYVPGKNIVMFQL